jgi:transcriptional regulator with XRE-family HTH domain
MSLPDLQSLTNAQICEFMGSRLRGERLRLGLTQVEAALRAGLPLRTYIRMEQNGRGKLSTFVAALRGLGRVAAVVALLPAAPAKPKLLAPRRSWGVGPDEFPDRGTGP